MIYSISLTVITMNDVQQQIFKSMFYGVVAAKRKVNKPIFVKLDDNLFNVALHIYFSYGFDKLPYDVRPMITNITSKVDSLSKVYYIVKTDMEAFINCMPVEINSYGVSDEDIFEVISGVSSKNGIIANEELAEVVIEKINNDDSIKDEVCKSECKQCSCMKQKIKKDIERNLEGVVYE